MVVLEKARASPRRTKRCRACGPCKVIKNCGTCKNCLNRKTRKQACILRKCAKILERQKEQSKINWQRRKKKINRQYMHQQLPVFSDIFNGRAATPTLLEPRLSASEPECVLEKKLKPAKRDGKIEVLPSFDTFCNLNQCFSSPNKRKLKGPRTKLRRKIPKVTKHSCGCPINENINTGPFYTHLGSGRTLEELKTKLQTRYDVNNSAIRIHLVRYTTTEGKNGDGCPLAKWVLRREGPEEKYLVITKQCDGHVCNGAYIVIAIVAWEGISKKYADDMYQYLRQNLNTCGFSTRRRCGTNDSKTCQCNGEDEDTNGKSFTFGCSWSLFFDGCKFAKSKIARKFRMQEPEREEEMEKVLQQMATHVSPLLNIWSPQAYKNMTHFDKEASDCRIGLNEGRPFSGVTCCLDFCTHSHKDIHNMNNGTTMVCTLLRPDCDERDDEQLHVLPLYQLLDENGHVAPTNYDIPEHFIKSKTQDRQEPLEGKGKYVCKSAVSVTPQKQTTSEDPLIQDHEQIPLFSINDNAIQNVFVTGLNQPNGFMSNNHVTSLPTFINENSLMLRQNNFDIDMKPLNMFQETMKIETNTGLLKMDDTKMKVEEKEHTSKPTVISHDMGGVAIALGHGSFLVECAKKEVHATTALKYPQRTKPTRISMVFYQHKKLHKKSHGYHDYKEKMALRNKEKKEKQSFDDLALLANTASLNDSMQSNASMDSTNPSEKVNPLLKLCEQVHLEGYNSAPDLPSLFDTPKHILPLDNKIFTGFQKKPVQYIVPTHRKDSTSFSIDKIMQKNENVITSCPNTAVNMKVRNNSLHANHPSRRNFQRIQQKKKLPTISIFSKRLTLNEQTESKKEQLSNAVQKQHNLKKGICDGIELETIFPNKDGANNLIFSDPTVNKSVGDHPYSSSEEHKQNGVSGVQLDMQISRKSFTSDSNELTPSSNDSGQTNNVIHECGIAENALRELGQRNLQLNVSKMNELNVPQNCSSHQNGQQQQLQHKHEQQYQNQQQQQQQQDRSYKHVQNDEKQVPTDLPNQEKLQLQMEQHQLPKENHPKIKQENQYPIQTNAVQQNYQLIHEQPQQQQQQQQEQKPKREQQWNAEPCLQHWSSSEQQRWQMEHHQKYLREQREQQQLREIMQLHQEQQAKEFSQLRKKQKKEFSQLRQHQQKPDEKKHFSNVNYDRTLFEQWRKNGITSIDDASQTHFSSNTNAHTNFSSSIESHPLNHVQQKDFYEKLMAYQNAQHGLRLGMPQQETGFHMERLLSNGIHKTTASMPPEPHRNHPLEPHRNHAMHYPNTHNIQHNNMEQYQHASRHFPDYRQPTLLDQHAHEWQVHGMDCLNNENNVMFRNPQFQNHNT